jgi:hypothetical protein
MNIPLFPIFNQYLIPMAIAYQKRRHFFIYGSIIESEELGAGQTYVRFRNQ